MSLAVDGTGRGVLVLECGANPGVGAPIVVAPHQQFAVHAERGEFVGGQIHPVAVEVLVDVAQEVGQLKGLAQCLGARFGVPQRPDRAQDGQHLQSDDFGRSPHVAVQRRPVGVVGDGEVHPHRRQEVVEEVQRDAVGLGGVQHGGQHRFGVGVAVEEPVRQPLESVGPIGHAGM